MRRLVTLCFLPVCWMAGAHAQQLDAMKTCEKVLTSGLREYSIQTDSSAFLNSVFDSQCDSSGSSKSSGGKLALDNIVDFLPGTLKGSYTSSEEAMRNFCRAYASLAAGRSESTRYQEKIVTRAYDSFDQCVAFARSDVVVRHDVRSAEYFDFFVAPGFGHPVTVKGVQTSANITCRAQDPSASGNQLKVVDMSSRFRLTNNKTLNIVCQRKSSTLADGATEFAEGVVTVLTDLSPTGNYAAFLPYGKLLPQASTADVLNSIGALDARQRTSEATLTRLAPIDGALVAAPGTGGGPWDMAPAVCPAGSYVVGVGPAPDARIRGRYGDGAILAVQVQCRRLGPY